MIKTFLITFLIVCGLGVLIYSTNKSKTPEPSKVAYENIITTPTPTPFEIPTTGPAVTISKNASPSPEVKITTATIKTSKGDIVVTLYPKDAPLAVANFISKGQSGYYSNMIFHRVEDWVIQGGDPKGNGTGGNDTLKTEPNNKPFIVGSLGMARKNDPAISNDSQFFITKTMAQWLNGQYTNFGIVKQGMDVVNKIQVGDKILSITFE